MMLLSLETRGTCENLVSCLELASLPDVSKLTSLETLNLSNCFELASLLKIPADNPDLALPSRVSQ